MSVQFYETRAGRTFYESTMPALVAELARLNDLLAKLADGPRGDRTPDRLDAIPALSPRSDRDPQG